MNDHWSTLVGRVLISLPDSIDERRQVLSAAAALVPKSHALWNTVTESLAHLEHHLAAQQEFALATDLATRGGRRLSDRADVRGGGRLADGHQPRGGPRLDSPSTPRKRN